MKQFLCLIGRLCALWRYLKDLPRCPIEYPDYVVTKDDIGASLRRRWEYPQLWCHIPIKRRTRRRRFVEWLCKISTGHEISKTEFGYGGGGMADYHCRWCDKLIQMPLREETDKSRLDLAAMVSPAPQDGE